MKKNFLIALMLITLTIVAFGTISVSAASYDFDYEISNNEVTITYLNMWTEGSITIPDTIEGYPVTSIYKEAFYDCINITSITIPASIKSIGRDAFYNCRSLKGVYIKDLKSWCNIDFYNEFSNPLYYAKNLCLNGSRITNLTIPNSVTSIRYLAFYNCTSLTSVTIPDSVTSVGRYAFASCTGLTSVTIGEGVTSIGDKTFHSCKGLTSITIPNSVTSIGVEAFRNCTGLTSITIPGSVTSIGYGAFYNSTGLTSVTIGKGVTSIGDYAFSDCTGLTKVNITDLEAWCNIDFKNSWSNPLYYAKNLYLNDNLITELVIPESVTSIGNRAFSDCIGLTSVTIPDSVTSIGYNAFYNCNSLVNVCYNGTEEDWSRISIGSNNTLLKNVTIHYFAYVNFFDKDKNKLISVTQNMNEYIDTSLVVAPEGYDFILYTDEDCTEKYDITTPVTQNLTLYVDFIKLNKIEFKGTTTADIGEKGFPQLISFSTDKEAKYFSCTLKVPNGLAAQEVKSDIFDIEQDYEVIGNDTYYYLFLIYNGDGNIPTYKPLNVFEVVLDVAENAVTNEILTIEILDDAFLADDNGNSYEFLSIGKAEIKINPILAEEITIVGADEIDVPTQYTVSVLPENATNITVEWSVSDETIATISEDGLLTPVKKGNVTVRATAKDGSGVYAEKTVSVKVLGTVNSIITNIGIWDKEYSPDTTNYTIYVPKTTTSIRLTALHGGKLKTDKITFVNNVTRPVTLSTTSDETVLELTYTSEGYDDNKYTITIIKFEGTKTEVSEDKKSFSITPINVEIGKTVILALYNGEQFVEMQSAVYTGEAIPFTTAEAYTNAKVFVWENFETLVPICESEIVK